MSNIFLTLENHRAEDFYNFIVLIQQDYIVSNQIIRDTLQTRLDQQYYFSEFTKAFKIASENPENLTKVTKDNYPSYLDSLVGYAGAKGVIDFLKHQRDCSVEAAFNLGIQDASKLNMRLYFFEDLVEAFSEIV